MDALFEKLLEVSLVLVIVGNMLGTGLVIEFRALWPGFGTHGSSASRCCSASCSSRLRSL